MAHDWRAEEGKKYKTKIETETTTRGDAIFWNANGAPVPLDIFKSAGLTPPSGQARAIREETDRALGNYRAARARMTPEQKAEEAFERRAAFGPGVEVVNVVTGERYRT